MSKEIILLIIYSIVGGVFSMLIFYEFRQAKDVRDIKLLLLNRISSEINTINQIEELQNENELLKQQNEALNQQNQVLMNAFELKSQNTNNGS